MRFPGKARAVLIRLAKWARSRGPEAAHRFLRFNDPVSAARIPVANLKYTLRALEVLLSTGAAASSRDVSGDRWAEGFCVRMLGLRPARAQLHARIEDRVRRMLDSGWDEEVRRLLDSGLSRDSNSFQAIGYREVAEWVLRQGGEVILHGRADRIRDLNKLPPEPFRVHTINFVDIHASSADLERFGSLADLRRLYVSSRTQIGGRQRGTRSEGSPPFAPTAPAEDVSLRSVACQNRPR